MKEQLEAIRSWLGQGSINIFGMPYAGKDTQGGVLADLLNAELLGGGHILRNSIIPPHVQQIMEAGGLIPIEDYLQIVPPYLSQDRFKGKPLMLSAVGRWDGEQEGVLQATEVSGHPTKAVVLLTVPEAVARGRHSRAVMAGDRGARADDAEEVFDTRLQEYAQKTRPVINFYREKGLLIEVDGTQEPPEVTSMILDALTELAERSDR
jgi:adenylate kinase